MTVVRYIVEVDTNAPERQFHRVDMALAKEIHHAFPLCKTEANPVQRAHLYRVVGPTHHRMEILFDPVRADREEPPGYISPVGAIEEDIL